MKKLLFIITLLTVSVIAVSCKKTTVIDEATFKAQMTTSSISLGQSPVIELTNTKDTKQYYPVFVIVDAKTLTLGIENAVFGPSQKQSFTLPKFEKAEDVKSHHVQFLLGSPFNTKEEAQADIKKNFSAKYSTSLDIKVTAAE